MYERRLNGKETSCPELINRDGRIFLHPCTNRIKELAAETEMFGCEKLVQK